MGSPVRLYQKEMHDNLGFFANWLPGDRLNVGDAGVLQNGRFRRMASLDELGIPCELEPTVRSRQDLQYRSSKGLKLTPEVGAELAGLAEATIDVKFSRVGAFLFHVDSLITQALGNRLAVEQHLRAAVEEKRWRTEWLLVDAVHLADRAVVLVSQDKTASVTLTAKVSGGLLGLSLADPRVSLRVLSESGTVVHTVGRRDLRPLYSCMRMKDPLFGAPSMTPVRGSGGGRDSAFARPAIGELLES